MLEIFKEILEVREINKATRNHAIILSMPRNNPKFKSENFWVNPSNPMILEFNLKQIPPLWSKIGIIIYILNDEDDEENFIEGH